MLLVALVIGRAEFLRVARVVYAVGELLELVVVGRSQSVVVDLVECVNLNRVVVGSETLAAALSRLISCATGKLALVIAIVVHLGRGVEGHVD